MLPMLWWGMPLSVSCPMTAASAPATPSGLCSYFGITLKIEGSQKDVERYRIKGKCVLSVNNDLHKYLPSTINGQQDVLLH